MLNDAQVGRIFYRLWITLFIRYTKNQQPGWGAVLKLG